MSFFQHKAVKIAMAVLCVLVLAACAVFVILNRSSGTEEETASSGVTYYNTSGEKIAYLTFDDGPSNSTATILSILEEAGIKATFYTTYKSSNTLQEYYSDIVDAGHLLGTKGYTDSDSIYASASDYMADLQKMQNFLEITVQMNTSYVRLIGGSDNAAVDADVMQQILLNLDRNQYLYCDWNVSVDGEGSTASADDIVRLVVGDAMLTSEPVILLHDINDNDAMIEALPQIISQLQEAGYGFDTIDHMGTPLHNVEYTAPDYSDESFTAYDPIVTSSATSSYETSGSTSSSTSSSSSSKSSSDTSGEDDEDESGTTTSEDTSSSSTSSASTSHESSE